ncbi:MAG: hypothetical protein ACYDCO_13345 [Armatimonadota bacterium]
MLTIHPGLRYLWLRAALNSLPSFAIVAGCGYGLVWARGTQMSLMFVIGLVIMGIVFVGISGSNVWWLVQASRLISSREPVAMMLTADQRWSELTLNPVNPGQPSLTGVDFITIFSGVKRVEQHGTPVWVYYDQAITDLVVMRFQDRLLVTENRQRMNGGFSTISRKVVTPEAEVMPAMKEAMPALENPRIQEDLAVLVRDMTGRYRMLQVGIVVISSLAVVIFGLWKTVWHLPYLLSALLHGVLPDSSVLPQLGGLLVVIGLLFYGFRFVLRTPQFIARGLTVVQTTPPVQWRLHATVKKEENSVEITIAVHDPAVETDPLFAIELFSDFSETQAADVDGTLGLVYATNPDEPVVIQTVSGLVVGKRMK